jgi:hypothetical protein
MFAAVWMRQTGVLAKHLPADAQSKIAPLAEAVCAAVAAAQAKHSAVWPSGVAAGPSSPDGNKKTNFDASAEETVRVCEKATLTQVSPKVSAQHKGG